MRQASDLTYFWEEWRDHYQRSAEALQHIDQLIKMPAKVSPLCWNLEPLEGLPERSEVEPANLSLRIEPPANIIILAYALRDPNELRDQLAIHVIDLRTSGLC